MRSYFLEERAGWKERFHRSHLQPLMIKKVLKDNERLEGIEWKKPFRSILVGFFVINAGWPVSLDSWPMKPARIRRSRMKLRHLLLPGELSSSQLPSAEIKKKCSMGRSKLKKANLGSSLFLIASAWKLSLPFRTLSNKKREEENLLVKT